MMVETYLKSKITDVVVTNTNFDYANASIEISTDILVASNIKAFEKVLVVNNNNGERWETYAIPSKKPKEVNLNGAGVRYGIIGDKLMICSFVMLDVQTSLDDYKGPTFVTLNGIDNYVINVEKNVNLPTRKYYAI